LQKYCIIFEAIALVYKEFFEINEFFCLAQILSSSKRISLKRIHSFEIENLKNFSIKQLFESIEEALLD